MLEADYSKRLMKLHSKYRVSQSLLAEDGDADPVLALQESPVQQEVGGRYLASVEIPRVIYGFECNRLSAGGCDAPVCGTRLASRTRM